MKYANMNNMLIQLKNGWRRYKCEVSTEGPHFNTDYREDNLTVYGKL